MGIQSLSENKPLKWTVCCLQSKADTNTQTKQIFSNCPFLGFKRKMTCNSKNEKVNILNWTVNCFMKSGKFFMQKEKFLHKKVKFFVKPF